MTGLDPLGRRDVRDLILTLRSEGRTVLVSSHVLSEAEAVCSHVAILDHGRLAAAGRIADLDLDVRGWELVVAGVDESHLTRCARAARRMTRVDDGRYVIDLPVDRPPEPIVADLAGRGVRIVSLNAKHETLEDYFLRRVNAGGRATPAASRPGQESVP